MKDIKVIFRDGMVIENNHASETFIEVIRKIGVERIMALGIETQGVPVVSEEKVTDNEAKLSCVPVDGYWVYYGHNNKSNRNVLRKISSRLGLGLKVEPGD